MIVVVCPGCGSKLHAKDELAGQTRKCPKCAAPVQIVSSEPKPAAPAAEPLGEPSAEAHVEPEAAAALPQHHDLVRLNRQHYYLICDRGRVLAIWEGNGRGWMLKTNTGLVSASRSTQQLPPQGDFRLVELVLSHGESGLRLSGVHVFRLVQHWALAALAKGDDEIVRKIAGPGGLNREQKGAVRSAMKERYMHDVWASAESVMEYLANGDFHSSGV